MKTLVCGLPGTGKTTFVKNNIGRDGLCYDLDAMAAAFRLKEPHEEKHTGAMLLANDLLFAFFTHVDQYTGNAFIIRAAPTYEEFKRIAPKKVVICRTRYVKRPIFGTSESEMLKRIDALEQICLRQGITCETPPQEKEAYVMPSFCKK